MQQSALICRSQLEFVKYLISLIWIHHNLFKKTNYVAQASILGMTTWFLLSISIWSIMGETFLWWTNISQTDNAATCQHGNVLVKQSAIFASYITWWKSWQKNDTWHACGRIPPEFLKSRILYILRRYGMVEILWWYNYNWPISKAL